MDANISREQIKAFLTLYRKRTFSEAARTLSITQAAFSIRIQRLEDELQHTLLVRNKTGIELTEAGKKFLTFCELNESLEQEFLTDFMVDGGPIRGTVSVASYSSIGKSLVMPALAKLLREHSEIGFDFKIKELGELPPLLSSAAADFIFLDAPLKKEGVESILLGYEEYVHITSTLFDTNQDVYLNHDEQDLMSFRYYDHIGAPVTQLKRRYLDEINSVIEGVALGVGVSILPEHLIKQDKRIKIVAPRKRLPVPVYLCYRARSYYPRAFTAVLEVLKKEIPRGLK